MAGPGTVRLVGDPAWLDDDQDPAVERLVVRRGAGPVGVVVLALVVVGVVALWWSGRDGGEVASPPPTTSDLPPPTTTSLPPPTTEPRPVPGAGRVTGTGGEPVAGVGGSLVLAGPGDTSVWVAPLDGRPVRRVDGPALVADVFEPDANPVGPTVVRETVVWAADGGVWALPVGELASGIAVGVGIGGLEAPVVATAPAPDRRSVWVHTRPSGADVFWRLDVVTLAPQARVVLGDGETSRPDGLALLGATDLGPLVRWPGAGGGAGLWALAEAGGPHVRLGDDAVVLASGAGAVVVEEVPAAPGRPAGLALVDPATGGRVAVPAELLPAPGVGGVAVAPSGARLALWGSGGIDSPGELVVLSLGRDGPVEESRVELAPTVVDVRWSPDGAAAVVLDADRPQRWRLAAWRAADGRLVELPVAVELVPVTRARAPSLVGVTRDPGSGPRRRA